MKFIVIAHNDNNKLVRCISSICTNKDSVKEIDILYNKENSQKIKNALYTLEKINPDIKFKIKRFNIHKRDIYKSVDILMIRKWIKKINNEFIVVCNEDCIFKSTYINDFYNDIDLHYNGEIDDINLFLYGNPIDWNINGNGKSIYRRSVLLQIPDKFWRKCENINQLYKYYFSEFCQSKIFFENLVEAETNRKFHVIKYDNVIID